jgi:hypothetical protein
VSAPDTGLAGKGSRVLLLVAAWLILTAILVGCVLLMIEAGRALPVIGLLGTWASLTGLIAMRLWPRSRVAQALAPDPRLTRPEPHGWLWILAALAALVVIVAVTILAL